MANLCRVLFRRPGGEVKDQKAKSVGPTSGPTDLCVIVDYFSIIIGIGLGGVVCGNWNSRSLEAFPKDLVVEFGRNAVFSRKVESAGFLRPVFHVMSWLQVRTLGEYGCVWVQVQGS
jgi:hypothetical protein